jgi:hypothetical protein
MDIYNRGRGCFYLIRACCWKAQAKKSRGQPRAINWFIATTLQGKKENEEEKRGKKGHGFWAAWLRVVGGVLLLLWPINTFGSDTHTYISRSTTRHTHTKSCRSIELHSRSSSSWIAHVITHSTPPAHQTLPRPSRILLLPHSFMSAYSWTKVGRIMVHIT